MKEIENKPLTKSNKLPIQIANKKELDLTKSDIPNQGELVQKLLQEISKLEGSEKIIFGHSSGSESYVMAKINPNKVKDIALIFTEPNPVTIYYNTALEHVKSAINLQSEIISKGRTPDELYSLFIEFLKEAFQGITQLTMSLEALFNQLIPEDVQLDKGEKVLSKKDIEWENFKEKYRNTLPKITEIDIYTNYNNDYQNIIRLNSLRNNLVHLKSIKQDNFTYYQSLYKELIEFNFETHASSVYNVIMLFQ